MNETDTLIVGASISGLACSASLHKQNIEYIIIEKKSMSFAPWRKHYDRLHLHTSKRFSNLPYKKFGNDIPRYPGRQQVIDYLEEYQLSFGIHPVFNTEARSIKEKNGYWMTETNNGTFKSKYVIMATGAYGKPKRILFNGMETFGGKILHSCEYKTGKDFAGQKVLVVGFGNSACEIAMDLFDHGAFPSMSVRSAVNVIPRDVFGIPVLELSLLLSRLKPRIADTVSAPLINLLIGNIKKLGLKKKPYGALEEISRDRKAPVLDIGTISYIRKGNIKIYDDIEQIQGNTIIFKDRKNEYFDSIVAAIGYSRDSAEIVDVEKDRFGDLNVNINNQKYFGKDGLYFCGYWISPTGQIREIAMDAKKIARDIASRMVTLK